MFSRPREKTDTISNRRLNLACNIYIRSAWLHWHRSGFLLLLPPLPMRSPGWAQQCVLRWVVAFAPSLSFFLAVSYLPSQTEGHPLYCHLFSLPLPSIAASPKCACHLPQVWWAPLHQDGSAGEGRWKGRVGCCLREAAPWVGDSAHMEGTWTCVRAQAAASHRDRRRDPEIYIQFLHAPFPGCPFLGKNLE